MHCLQTLTEVPDWAERYRSRNTGSFPGTGPAIYQGTTYFTDNTYPVMLYKPSYNLFSKALQGEQQRESGEMDALKRLEISQPGECCCSC